MAARSSSMWGVRTRLRSAATHVREVALGPEQRFDKRNHVATTAFAIQTAPGADVSLGDQT